MLPIAFKEQNTVFLKPGSMTDEECGDLSVWKGVSCDGFPSIISCWKLSYEDLQEIQKTGVVWLSVVSNSMPPVNLFTESPFVQPESPNPCQ